jgi:hypothetical protein
MGKRQRTSRSSRTRAATLVLTGALVGAVLAGPVVASAGNGYRPIWQFVKSKLSAAGTINQANNPVDFTRLKNVPAGLADGVDDVGGFGTLTTVESSDIVAGNVEGNGSYVLEDVQAYCAAGQLAISANPYYQGDLNGGVAGGPNDMELTIASVRRISAGGAEGYLVWGGNDTDTDSVLTLEVLCLTP